MWFSTFLKLYWLKINIKFIDLNYPIFVTYIQKVFSSNFKCSWLFLQISTHGSLTSSISTKTCQITLVKSTLQLCPTITSGIYHRLHIIAPHKLSPLAVRGPPVEIPWIRCSFRTAIAYGSKQTTRILFMTIPPPVVPNDGFYLNIKSRPRDLRHW